MELPDLEITVHSIALESSLVSTARAEKMEVYIDVDLLGLGDEGLLTPRVRPDEGELPLDFHEAIAVEPGEPVWAPLREALRSADEQDSDVYFVLHGASPTAAPRELGSAHLNLERLLALDADADHERLPVVDGDGRRVAMVSVSLKARAALKWCKRGADETKLKLGVRVGAAVLSAAAGARLEGRTALQVEVELPGGLPPMRTEPSRAIGAQGKPARADFAFSGEAEVAAGSPAHAELAAALAELADGEEAGVKGFSFVVVAPAAAGVNRVEVCRATLPLSEALGKNDDEAAAARRDAAAAPRGVGGGVRHDRSAARRRAPRCARSAARAAAAAALHTPTAVELAKATEAAAADDDDDDETARGTGVPWSIFDALAPKTLAELTRAPPAGEGAAARQARASREASELSTVVATAGRLARRTPLRADFSSEKWTGGKAGRAEKLWHTMAAVALHGETQKRQAKMMCEAAELKRLAAANARAELGRRQRLRVRAARATEAARGRERAAADRKERMDAVMLRERVAQYEKLLHGLHAVAAQAVDAAAECQKRIDAAEILIEDGRPGGARPADKLAPSLARYTAVLPHCTAMITGPPPPPVPPAIEWAAAAASRRGRRIGGGARERRRQMRRPQAVAAVAAATAAAAADPLGAEATEALQAAVAHALGDGRTAAALRLDRAARAAAGRAGDGTRRGGGVVSAEVITVTLTAGRLKVRGDAGRAVANNSVSLALSLLPSTLRLPAVRTASAMLNGAEVDFGFAGDLTMRSGGDAWDLLSRLIADAPASAAAGPAALQLRAQLAVTDSASGGSREIASAVVPFWPLLSSPLLFDAAPVALRGTDGTVVADVRLGARAPRGDEHAARGGGGGAGGVSDLPRAEAAPRRLQRRERAQRLGRDRSSRALRHAAAHDLRRAHRRRWRPHPPRCRAQGGSDGARRRRRAARRPAPPLAPMRR